MKKNIIIAGAALLLFLFVIYTSNQQRISGKEAKETVQQTEIENTANSPLPESSNVEDVTVSEDDSLESAIDFTLTDLDGNQVNLKDLRGKSVYLNFWATWCKWCKKELPDINKINGIYKDKDVVVLAISVGEDQKLVSGFMQEHSYDLTTLVDPDKQVAGEYGVTALPVSIFIDKNGKIIHRKLGTMYEEELTTVIDDLLLRG